MVMTPYLWIRRKAKESSEIVPEGFDFLGHILTFFTYIIVGSIGFRRVAVLAIGSVRKETIDDSRFHLF